LVDRAGIGTGDLLIVNPTEADPPTPAETLNHGEDGNEPGEKTR
jgi:hypothetical protein